MGGAAGTVAAGSILKQLGSVAGAVGEIFGERSKARFPQPTRAERRYRRRTNQMLRQGRRVAEEGTGLQAELIPLLLGDLGYEFDTVDQRPELSATLAELTSGQNRLAALRGEIRGAKKAKAGRKAVRALNQERRGIRQRLPFLQSEAGRLQSQPIQLTNLRKKAPSIEASTNQDIQDMLAERVRASLRGDLPDDPRLLRELGEQERVLKERLRRDLGGGFETSTPGEQALADFGARRAEVLTNAQRNDLNTLQALRLGSAATLEDLEGSRQARVLGLPRERLTAGNLLASLGLANVRAQEPFQFDRMGEYNESVANLGTPDSTLRIGSALYRNLNEVGDEVKSLGGAGGMAGLGGGGGGGGGGGSYIY